MSGKRGAEGRTYTPYGKVVEDPLPPIRPPTGPFSFLPPFPFPSSAPSFQITLPPPAALPSPGQRERLERQRREEEEQRRRRAAEARRAQEEQSRAQARAREERARVERQRAISDYMQRQRQLGIPDLFYVQLDGEEVVVHRNQYAPNEFWVLKGDPRGGVGELVFVSPGDPSQGFRFRWLRIDEIDPTGRRRQLMQRQQTFLISDQPRSIPTPARPPPPPKPPAPTTLVPRVAKPPVDKPQPVRKLPPVEKPRPAPPPAPPRVELKVVPSREISSLEKEQEQLEEKEMELADILEQSKETLAERRKSLQLKARIAQEQLQLLELERRRLQEQKRKELEQEVKDYRRKRLKEKELKEEVAVAEEKETIRKRLKQLTEEIRQADPEAVLKRAEEELQRVRQVRIKSEAIQQRVTQSQDLVSVINRRLFSPGKSRPRTLNEILVNLSDTIFTPGGKSFQQFARERPAPFDEQGLEIDPFEDVISVENQQRLVRAYLCGFGDTKSKKYQPGFFEAELKLQRGDCPIKFE